MRVLHIIPLAFNYFNDIARVAFKMAEGLEEAGVNVDIVTLQYTKPTREQQAQVAEAAPSREYKYVEQQPVERVVESVKEEDFQLVHLHCPFFGAGNDWLRFKKENPEFPLVVTYHRDFALTDFFSLYVKMYNRYYAPRFFSVADVVTSLNFESFYHTLGYKYLKNKEKFISLLPNTETHLKVGTTDTTQGRGAMQLLENKENFVSATETLLGIYGKLIEGYRLV